MPAILSLTMADAYGRNTTKLIELKTQVDLAAYDALAAAVVVALDAITDLGTVRADLILKGVVDLTAYNPAPGSNVDVGGTFTGTIADGNGKKASHKVPGISATFVDADGTIPVEAEVATYLAQFEELGELLLSDGESIDEWLRGGLDR